MRAVAALCAACAGAGGARVVGIADLHGDYDKTVEVLAEAGLVERGADPPRWAGGATVVVQTGDMLDRGPRHTDIVDLFERLREEAQAAGGEVVTLLGNHEVFSAMGRVRYVHDREIAKHGGAEAYRAQFASTGMDNASSYGTVLAARLGMVVRAHTLFVHAGVCDAGTAGRGVRGVNRKLRSKMRRGRETGVIMGAGGPMWCRKLVREAQKGSCAGTRRALEAMPEPRPVRMVVGHTPLHDRVEEFCGGLLVDADLAMSAWMSDRDSLGYYVIEGGRAEALYRAAAPRAPPFLFGTVTTAGRRHPFVVVGLAPHRRTHRVVALTYDPVQEAGALGLLTFEGLQAAAPADLGPACAACRPRGFATQYLPVQQAERVYVACGDGGVAVADVAADGAVTMRGCIASEGGAAAVAVVGSVLAVAGTRRVTLYNVAGDDADPLGFVAADGDAAPEAVYISAGYVNYKPAGASVRAVDISVPSAPFEPPPAEGGAQADDAVPFAAVDFALHEPSRMLFAALGEGGVGVYNATAAPPAFRHRLAAPDGLSVRALAVEGDAVYALAVPASAAAGAPGVFAAPVDVAAGGVLAALPVVNAPAPPLGPSENVSSTLENGEQVDHARHAAVAFANGRLHYAFSTRQSSDLLVAEAAPSAAPTPTPSAALLQTRQPARQMGSASERSVFRIIRITIVVGLFLFTLRVVRRACCGTPAITTA